MSIQENLEKISKEREELQLQQEKLLKILTGKPSIDQPWLKYYDREFKSSDIPAMSIYQLAYESNKNNMDSVAMDVRTSQNDYKKGIKITYKDFFKKINDNAKSSKRLGIKTDDIVPIILPNVPEARTLLYSNSVLGSISFPISPLMPANQLNQIIEENEIKTLFVFSMFLEKYGKTLENSGLENVIVLDGTESLPEILRKVTNLKNKLVTKNGNILKTTSDKFIPWDEYHKLRKNMADLEPYYKDDHIAAILGTSGTTGYPKGVCMTDRNINAAALGYKNAKIFKGNFMDALIPSIGYGISTLHHQILDQKYTYLIPELITTNTAKAICTLKPDNFPGGPVHYLNILASEEYKKGILPPHQNFISGGATLPSSVESALNGVNSGYEEKKVNDSIFVRQGYGLTENVARATYSVRGAYKFGSIGIPMPYETISIFKPDTDEELGYNEPGEICITGDSVMKCYLNNEEETNKVIKIHSDGKRWIHTKDIGYMDEDGHLFFKDRIKNIFMRTGFNVHPSKIAEFIDNIPYVLNSVVIGFDHPREQCVPIAFIELDPKILNEKTEEEIREEIKNLCYTNLEETSVPYEYIFTDTLPVNLGGKIDTQLIAQISGIDLMKNDKVLKRNLKFNK